MNIAIVALAGPRGANVGEFAPGAPSAPKGVCAGVDMAHIADGFRPAPCGGANGACRCAGR